MLLSVNQFPHHRLTMSFSDLAPFFVSRTELGANVELEVGAPQGQKQATLLAQTSPEVSVRRSASPKERDDKLRLLEQMSQRLSKTHFRFLKRHLELIIQGSGKNKISALVQLIHQSQGNKEFQKLFSQILEVGIASSSSDSDKIRLLQALAARSRGQERLQWSIFNLSRVLGQSGLPILNKLASQTRSHHSLAVEIIDYLSKNHWIEMREGSEILANLAQESTGNEAFQDTLFELAKKSNSLEGQMRILAGLAKASPGRPEFQKHIYDEVKYERAFVVKDEKAFVVRDEGGKVQVFAQLLKSKWISAELKTEIFESMNGLKEFRNRVLLLEAFARTSAQDPQFQASLLKNYILPMKDEAARGRVLVALASQSKKNPELQLDLFECIKDLSSGQMLSAGLNELIVQGQNIHSGGRNAKYSKYSSFYSDNPLQKRILKFYSSNAARLNEPLLLSSLAKVSDQDISLQNWILRRLEKLSEPDQASVLISLALLAGLDSETKEKIRDRLQTNQHELAKEGMALLQVGG